jgi:hypothetical protein
MNKNFDELAKGLAQSVTRRQALKKFGVSLAGMALAGLGAGRASAGSKTKTMGLCHVVLIGFGGGLAYTGVCIDPTTCQTGHDPSCKGRAQSFAATHCSPGQSGLVGDRTCSF